MTAVALLTSAAGRASAQSTDVDLSYFPLAIGNYWQYEVNWSGVGVNGWYYPVVRVVDTATLVDGLRYFVVTSDAWPPYDAPWMALQYMRIDSATGVVYRYLPSDTVVVVWNRLRCDSHADSTVAENTWVGCAQDTSYWIRSYLIQARLRYYWSARQFFGSGLGMIGYYRSHPMADPEQSTTTARLLHAMIGGVEVGPSTGVAASARAGAASVSITANPVRDLLQLTLHSESPCVAHVDLATTLGEVVRRRDYRLTGGADAAQQIDVRDLPEGAYFLRGRIANETVALQIRVLR